MLGKPRVHTIILVCGLALLLATGCALLGRDEAATEPTPAAAMPTPASSPTPANTPAATTEAGAPQAMTLNVWTVPGIAPGEETVAERLMAEQFAAFDTSHPNVSINVAVKTPTGQGGTLSFLRTGRGVAPAILPDLILLPADQLATAVREQLVYPLDSLVTEEMLADLYPAARALGTVNNSLYGYPLSLSGLQHVSYASGTVFSETLPLVWDEFIATPGAAFALAGAGAPGAELALQGYLSSGGPLLDEQGRPMLDPAVLTPVLEALQRGREQGAILVQSGNLTTLPEVYGLLNGGLANAVQTSAAVYLGQRPTPVNITHARLPGADGPLAPLVKGTVYAVSTPDAARQAVAAELLAWLASGENMGEWSNAAGLLPARRAAFAHWPQDDAYFDFLQGELERASAFPALVNATMMSALNSAVFEVVSLGEPAATAAATAAAALQP